MFPRFFKRQAPGRLDPSASIELPVFVVRGRKVILGEHLAGFYGAKPKQVRECVTRNQAQFAEEAAFQLTAKEMDGLGCPCGCLKCIRAVPDHPWGFSDTGTFKLAAFLGTRRAMEMCMMIWMMLDSAVRPTPLDVN